MEKLTFTRKELYDLVWAQPMLTLAKKYNISDVGLRKICKRLEVPVPKAGHWAKIKAGKKVTKEKLSIAYTGEQQVALEIRENGEASGGYPLSPYQVLIKEIKEDKRLNLTVFSRLTNPDPLIIKAKQSLAQKHKAWKFEGMIQTNNESLDIRVSPKNVDRALRFMDLFIKNSRARGHEVNIDTRGTYINVKGQRVGIQCKEISKKVVVNKGSWNSTEYHPTGILGFRCEDYAYGEWKDGKVLLLEEQIPRILAKMELAVQELLDIWEESRKREEVRKEKERIARELQLSKENELLAFKGILHKASRLHKAMIMRQYADRVEENAIANGNLTEELTDWLEWARKKADWYNPLIEGEDELLNDVDRNTLTFTKKPESNSWE